ncbi:zinc finger BED domain-containing protein RICESLEEPER 2-like [Typha latifolia]|uniref:zinc finger BED domain-containing protein RICESLEEPER 2-like n=1 Tax=Typha latifolia TaxID=4733 RepID=UPI003C2ADF09
MGEPSDTEPVSNEVTPPGSKRRRKKSMVWEHFTVEAVSGGCTRACCKLCKQTFAYSSGSKIAGTSHLKRHIALGSCPKIKSQERAQLALTSGTNADGGTTDPPKRRYRLSGFANATFDQDLSYTYLAKMIILHDYPLHIVEQPAFISFIESLQPRFRMVDVNGIEGEILKIYQKEKQNLMQAFGAMPGRVSLTIGLWMTSQTLGYVSLMGQFIDTDWKLHRRMLNFMMVSSPHSENALSEAISASLSDWNMKTKLFTITLDNNCSSHDIYSANLRDHLSNKNTLMLKGQLFVVRCYAHILNIVSQDVIASIHGIIYNIRESIKFVKASPAREERFAEIALQLEIPSTKTLSLDVTTQWNTTYLMLLAALEYKQAFTVLETCDDNYNEAPSSDDWKKVEVVCTYLKLLYDSANVVMATAEPTANIFFHEAWKIQLELTNATLNEDAIVSSIAKDMHEKFDKYWKDCSLVLAIAVVMDPRFKMKLVEFSFSKIYGADAARYVKVVNDAIHELYLEYVAQPLPLTPAYIEQGEDNDMNPMGNDYMNSIENDSLPPIENNELSTPMPPVENNELSTPMPPIEHNELSTPMPPIENNELSTPMPPIENNELSNPMPPMENNELSTPMPPMENNELSTPMPPIEDNELSTSMPPIENNELSTPMSFIENNQPSTPMTPNDSNQLSTPMTFNDNNQLSTPISAGDGLLDFEMYLSEMAVNQPTKPELEQYLEESLVPRIQEFDILNWWKLNTLKYPTLSKMARDVLAIPMSMISTGSSIFGTGTGSRILDEYRSSMCPETVEALFCAKDWLQYLPTMAEPPSTAIVKMEY